MPAETLYPYYLAILIASALPGPSMLLAIEKGAAHGWQAAMVAAAGNVAATTLQAAVAIAVLLGIGQFSPDALLWLRYLGGAYILYIGATLFRSQSFGLAPNHPGTPSHAATGRHFRQGFMFAIFNPKAIVFFASLFPQFIRSGQADLHGLLLIFVPIWWIAFACFMLYAVAGMALMRVMGQWPYTGRLFGSLIMLAGVALLLE